MTLVSSTPKLTAPISTHTSLVGCDDMESFSVAFSNDFYSHIPCGMWRYPDGQPRWSSIISTHTSLVGCDVAWRPGDGMLIFLLTHPLWDVTMQAEHIMKQNFIISTHTSLVGCDDVPDRRHQDFPISTHTSLVGCDFAHCAFLLKFQNFYSHIPCGMWPFKKYRCAWSFKFLLTHPLWDVTLAVPVRPRPS